MQPLTIRTLYGFLVWFFVSTQLQAQVQEDGRFHGRLDIKLAGGPGGSVSPCLKTQSPYDLRIARDDCAETEGVLAWSKYFLRGGAQQIWARAFIDITLKAPMERGWVDTTQGDQGLILGNRNFYGEVGNFWGNREVLWMGNRSYDYEDLWLLDLRILDQHGPGLGVSQIDVGLGKLALAFFRVNSKNGGPAQDSFDLRWKQIPFAGGFLKLAMLHTRTLSTDSKTGEKKYTPMRGSQFASIYQLEDEDSENKFFVQFGEGLYGGSDLVPFDQGGGAQFNNMGEDRDPSFFDQNLSKDERGAISKSKAYRVGNQFILYPEFAAFSLHSAVLFEKVDFGGLLFEDEGVVFDRPVMETRAWILKPVWDMTAHQSFALSHSAVLIQNGLGYKRRLPDAIPSESRRPVDRSLRRSEIAYTLRPLGWGGGTETKFYAAYNQWNSETRRDVTSGPLQQKTSGWTGGITLGYWW